MLLRTETTHEIVLVGVLLFCLNPISLYVIGLSSNNNSSFSLVLRVIEYIFCKFFINTHCSITFPQTYNFCELLFHLGCSFVMKICGTFLKLSFQALKFHKLTSQNAVYCLLLPLPTLESALPYQSECESGKSNQESWYLSPEILQGGRV